MSGEPDQLLPEPKRMVHQGKANIPCLAQLMLFSAMPTVEKGLVFEKVSQLTLRPKGHLKRIPEQKQQRCISSEWWRYACEVLLLAWRNWCRLQRTAKQNVEPTPF